MFKNKDTTNKNVFTTYLKAFLTCVFLLFYFIGQAQFTITEDFRGSGSPDIIIGGPGGSSGTAVLTSGVYDPVGAGWLRLTSSAGNQRGYAYVNKSFPSTLGLLIDFEYTMWRDVTVNSNYAMGGDGLSIFLFDATYGPGTFNTGAYGGSLGYANNTATSPTMAGLTGGYVGVGFDSYGNFTMASEGKNGGASALRPNSVSLRGPTTSTSASDTNTNKYLTGVTITSPSQTSNNFTVVDALNTAGNATHNVIDYNTVTSTRPGLTGTGSFYRRVQVEVIPTITNKYRIVVRWATTYGGTFTQLISYETTDVPPGLLKMGFAASSGGAVNYHEIRNLLITTPRNLRVTKKANKDILRSVSAGTNANKIEYRIEVVNDTDNVYTSATFLDKLEDINGNQIPTSMFTINSVVTSGFTSNSIAQVPGQNRIEGTFTIPANTVGYVTVTGTLSQIPSSNILTNTVTVLPTNGVDFDLGNNTSFVNTPVIAENVDMVIKKIADQPCLNSVQGNKFTITATNMGILPANYGGVTITGTGLSRTYTRNRIEVTEIVPSGATVQSSSIPSDWELVATQSNTPSVGFTSYVYRTKFNEPSRFLGVTINSTPDDKSLTTGMSLPSIVYTLKGSTTFENQAKVRYVQESGTVTSNAVQWTFNAPTSVGELEPIENMGNNTAKASVYSTPAIPTVTTPIYYCIGDTTTPLTATALPNNTLKWYLNQGGASSTIPHTPFAHTVGTTTYYVSQSNGLCEGALATIQVFVLPKPSAGTIGGAQTICSGGTTTPITSLTAGQATGWPVGTTISYRWEWSANGSTGWTSIAGANSASYTFSTITANRYYRRITIATIGSKSCESEPTTAVLKTVNTVNAGIISGNQTVCENILPAQITSTTNGSGSSGSSITYRWESSPSALQGSWTTIIGANSSTFTPGLLTKTNYYRRITISTLNNIVCEAESSPVLITVKNCKMITNPMIRQKVK